MQRHSERTDSIAIAGNGGSRAAVAGIASVVKNVIRRNEVLLEAGGDWSWHDYGGFYSRWEVRDGKTHPYENTFSPFLGGHSLGEFVSKRSKGDFLALDMMGYGQTLAGLPISKGLAVALGSPDMEPVRGNSGEVDLIRGDILKRSTWKAVKRWLEGAGRDGFDLILCRPVGGLYRLPRSIGLHAALLGRLWGILGSGGGVLMTEIYPFGQSLPFDARNDIDERTVQWAERTDRVEGIRVMIAQNGHSEEALATSCSSVLFIERSAGAPEALPGMAMTEAYRHREPLADAAR